MTDEATHVDDEGLLEWANDEAALDLVEQAFSLAADEHGDEIRQRPARTLSAAEIAEALGLPMPTAQQQAVIEAPLRPAIVVAGAGSGKTETMANRVVWLLANGHVRVPEILGLTFTRKAAGELAGRIRTRIEQLVASRVTEVVFDPFEAPEVATYNAFANAIFRENALLIGREPESAVLSEASAWQLARRLVVTSTDERLVELDKGVDAVTSAVVAVSRALSENVADPTEVERMVEGFARIAELPTGNGRVKELYASVRSAVEAVGSLPPLLDLARAFADEKRRRGFVEYSDQVAFALAVCERMPEVVADYRRRFRVVLLDEYQDTSVVQTRLLSTLFAGRPVMAVGDPHQSIYGWRGASAANLGRFSSDFTGERRGDHGAADEYALSTSWRNPTRVLDAANVLVGPLTAASPVHVEQLQPRPGAVAGELTAVFEQTVADEADLVARWLGDRVRRLGPDGSPPSAAMLCRSLKKIDVFTGALDRHGIPYHVLGLGGLLEQPVIADLLSALRVMHDPTAGSELIRLLTGAKWRVGPKDIAALRDVASWLAERDHRHQKLDPELRERLRRSVAGEESASLVDALDFVVEAPAGHSRLDGFSPPGLERMRDAGRRLDHLRSRAGLDLLDLVTLVQQELLLDIEVAANETAQLGHASLDAFAEQVASYLAVDDQATLGSFLSWLAEAEQRDNLAPRSEDPEPGTVQILTIHGAKGLEWDVVAVPRLVDGELPGPPQSRKGWLSFGQLPNEFRGDSAELPVIAWRTAETQKDVHESIAAFEEENVARHLEEQRRLIYVAVTRAKERLLLSGSYWSTQTRPRGPGSYLLELQEAGLLPEDAFPDCDEPDENPLTLSAATVSWPLEPLGARRERVEAAAEAVRRARESGAGDGGVYARDLDLLLAERARREQEAGLVELPARIPASRFKDYVTDPAGVAASLRRPMPERPYRQTRLGTLFHQWVEDRFGTVAGAADVLDANAAELDDPASDLLEAERFEELKATFERSPWSGRSPEEVELELHITLAGQVIVCKLDAVYRAEDGRHDYQIVDWKTGKAPRDADDLERKQLQLALYRLAFARYAGVDPERIDAVFYFVADDRVIRPERLYAEEELMSLWSSATGFIPPERR
ncbi:MULTISPECIES: ATP-dependent DNA helicase [unclassified Leifsonia]|uniref:ATP-dependent helicase n=1 Tax=unclassified Leifsonia TaxID=2663824 RepID=UPI0008A7D9D6|nr:MULTISPECIES: ATP-dependent DNA helicase [unclassified Leifsonia]SEH75344.1 DNA helicase-2 / ATP-dependent DNA helicase PcrA [Leifsonia sp. CL154]SFL36787.1 DNA helicase-2 / ATP-dependent DNA helicase PcrA [Leifsonia sp. CL147]